jgi:hypothetical protein
MCCSTCHMIFDPVTFAALGPVPDDEQDVIDRAAGVTDTSVTPRAAHSQARRRGRMNATSLR